MSAGGGGGGVDVGRHEAQHEQVDGGGEDGEAEEDEQQSEDHVGGPTLQVAALAQCHVVPESDGRD